MRHDAGPADADMTFFDTLAEVIRELDPDGIPVPMLLPASPTPATCRRSASRRTASCRCGCPRTSRSTTLTHAADERVPVDAVHFGAEAVFRAVQRYPG